MKEVITMKRDMPRKKIMLTFIDDNNSVKQKVFDTFADARKFLEDNSYHIYEGGGCVYGKCGDYVRPRPIANKFDGHGVKTDVYFLTV